jgi:hypothetical protein
MPPVSPALNHAVLTHRGILVDASAQPFGQWFATPRPTRFTFVTNRVPDR